ncbi:alpha/beta hydrolase [Chryseobacterium jejuense]|uniref:Pimeloyl-ACP methyl ester carboxylesterase n=1 Tax=Chryseobacterium jejuense TaxID=445960 RepID=A0A2X2VDT2_CHRJE|nr:alpha/beta hydrolase [Chryseobacterium jejuense]SDI95334.1 Pimeloyl-ACP methyl ester carboxylesterase [Chryseobacterium jejuense]SQB27176.1 short chain dehydrogenase [Chryseobacterium jejuense]
MRYPIISVITLLFSFIVFGQSKKPNNEYSEAREIIKDLDSIVAPNGIQERYKATIGGVKQWVYVRGQNKENPVILFVHGGPASPIAPVMWMFQRPIEEYFTVVNYDQRASGKTYNANDTLSLKNTININQYVDDAIQLAELIKEKYKKKKVLLIGHSWGTIISMKAALKRPDLFYAYVGIGQIINTRDNERLSVDFAVKEATRLKNDTALKELASIAPYPGNTPITRQRIIIARKWPQYYGGLTAYRNNSRYFFQAPLLSPEYSYDDAEAIGKGSLFTLSKVLTEFLDTDFKSVKTFPIPVFMFMGRHDYTTPSEPTAQWLKNVKAPFKKGIWFENSAHLIPFEEPGKMLVTLLNDVQPVCK